MTRGLLAAHLSDLAARRTELRLDAAFQRDELDGFLARSDVVSRWIERAQVIAREITERPLLMGAIALAVFAARPKRLIEIAAGGWWVWRVYSRVRQVLR
ncbi:MAG: hypothetical protein ACT4P4_12775 [Betaproteobacteria bacterium]